MLQIWFNTVAKIKKTAELSQVGGFTNHAKEILRVLIHILCLRA